MDLIRKATDRVGERVIEKHEEALGMRAGNLTLTKTKSEIERNVNQNIQAAFRETFQVEMAQLFKTTFEKVRQEFIVAPYQDMCEHYLTLQED